MKRPVIVIGAGGHGRVVADVLSLLDYQIEGFTDENEARWGARVGDIEVIGGDAVIRKRAADSILLANGLGSTGDAAHRRTVFETFDELGYTFPALVHPCAIVSRAASIEAGAQIMAGCIIQTGAKIGRNTIVNTGASVDHDCVIGRHCHIAPGCTLSGDIVLGDGCHIGTGSSVRHGVRLGDRVVVGVGAAVVADFEGPGTLIGVPARVLG